jgi:hypothetical protein
MSSQPLLRPPECFLLFCYKNVRGYTYMSGAEFPPWTPAIRMICQ